MTYIARPGDIFLTRFAGPIGPAIEVLQAVAAGDPSRYSHAGVIGRNGTVLEATGQGVKRNPLLPILERRPLAILRVPEWAEDRRDAIVDTAESLIGTPYGYLAYPYIGLARLGVQPRWLVRELASFRTLICSAYADRAWDMNGIHLFNDGRVRGAVTPGDLAHVGWTYHVGTGPYQTNP